MPPVTFRRKTIRPEQTLGSRLWQARQDLRLSLEEVERATWIRRKYLVALEEGRYHELPEDVYSLGFVQRYGEFLGFDPERILKQYRCERVAAERLGWMEPKLTPASLQIMRPLPEPKLVITPKLFWGLASLVGLVVIASYLFYQVQGFMAAPNLELAATDPDMVVNQPTIEISGRTDGSALVTINAEPVAIGPDGVFSQQVHLEPGVNTIEIAAKNRLNKETRKQLRVLANYQ